MVPMTDTDELRTGCCLCRGVSYEIHGKPRPVMYCHCEQCRKTSGHYVGATAVRPEQLVMREQKSLQWFRSSQLAQRGFCNICGSSLFWKPDHGRFISVMAGSVDLPSRLANNQHIFVDDAGDYYSIDDGLPQQRQYDEPVDHTADL